MPPPTIANLKAQGVNAFRVTCNKTTCLHSSFVSFADAGVDDQTPFPAITNRRRFVCSRCGGRAVSIMPDWRDHNASAVARH
jgi:hypothetical protein